MFCKNCKNEINEEAFICPHCGVLVNSSSQTPLIIFKNGKPFLTEEGMMIMRGVDSTGVSVNRSICKQEHL